MANQIRRVLSGAASWAMSLLLALGILIFLICCVICLSEGDPIWAFGPLAIFPGVGYVLRVYLSHVERKERHPAHLVVERLIFCAPEVLLGLFLIFEGAGWTYAPLSWGNLAALLVVVSAFVLLPPVLLARTLIRAFRGETGGEAPSEPETRAFWVNWI